jgi:flagellar assembly protein FliH
MQALNKFLFDKDFTANTADLAPPKPEDVALAFEEGRAQGQRDAAAQFEAEGQSALKAIPAALEQAVGSLDHEIARVEQEAIHLATELVRVYTAAALTHDPAPLIKALVKKATEAAGNIPTLSIYIGPKLTDSLRQDIEGAVTDAGFMGRIALIEDPSMEKGDVRVEWSEGGFKHSRSELDRLIDELIAAHQTPRKELSA